MNKKPPEQNSIGKTNAKRYKCNISWLNWEKNTLYYKYVPHEVRSSNIHVYTQTFLN